MTDQIWGLHGTDEAAILRHRYDRRTGSSGSRPEGRTALFACPNGHIGSLSDHEIADDGTVLPSVVCPHEGCDFHEFIKLEGWQSDATRADQSG